MDQIKRIGRELKYKGKILDFYEDTMQTPEGHIMKWDYLHHNGAAAVVPVDKDGKIYTLQEAYTLGYITDEHMPKIMERKEIYKPLALNYSPSDYESIKDMVKPNVTE